jgi:hypothetical protein
MFLLLLFSNFLISTTHGGNMADCSIDIDEEAFCMTKGEEQTCTDIGFTPRPDRECWQVSCSSFITEVNILRMNFVVAAQDRLNPVLVQPSMVFLVERYFMDMERLTAFVVGKIVVSQTGLCIVIQKELLLPMINVKRHSDVLNTMDLGVTRDQESGECMLTVNRKTPSYVHIIFSQISPYASRWI